MSNTHVDERIAGAEAPKIPSTKSEKQKGRRLIVILERACLETVKTRKGFELLNADDHLGIHRKLKRDPKDSRPDITHQLLLTLLDSPLNKAGLLQVYIRSELNVMIEVSPQIRIPRTFKRFAGLMVQLLHKMRIRASTSSQTLLKVVKSSVDGIIPPGARVIGTSMKGQLIDPHDLVPALPDDKPLVFVFGAMAQGFIEPDYAQEMYSFSNYALSAATAVNRTLAAFERHWGIL
jgi:rRNA small subunit pseudouridine methyltransferase Nep1